MTDDKDAKGKFQTRVTSLREGLIKSMSLNLNPNQARNPFGAETTPQADKQPEPTSGPGASGETSESPKGDS